MSRIPIPLPSYLDRCERLGHIYGQRRWRDPLHYRLLTWDGRHGEIEAFDLRGRHVAVLDAVTGEVVKPARKGRCIRV